jgi:transposase IS66-like protein
MVATLIQTAKPNDVDPQTGLADMLRRIVPGQTKRNELHMLLAWKWMPRNQAAVFSSASHRECGGHRHAYAETSLVIV